MLVWQLVVRSKLYLSPFIYQALIKKPVCVEMSGWETSWKKVGSKQKMQKKHYLQNSAQAFTADCICEIPCISTGWVWSLNTVHELSNVEKKNLGRDGIRTWGCWVRSANTTSVLCRSPLSIELIQERAQLRHLQDQSKRLSWKKKFFCDTNWTQKPKKKRLIKEKKNSTVE